MALKSFWRKFWPDYAAESSIRRKYGNGTINLDLCQDSLHIKRLELAILEDDSKDESPLRLSLEEYAFRLCFLSQVWIIRE